MTPGEEIVAWLEGLETCLRSVRDGRAPSTGEERETMRQRAGIYEGIASDIKRKWPALFVQCAGQAPRKAGEP